MADYKGGRHGSSGGVPKTSATHNRANLRNQTLHRISSSPITSYGVSFSQCYLCLVTLFLTISSCLGWPSYLARVKGLLWGFLLNTSGSHWGKQNRNTDSTALISSVDLQSKQSLQQITCLKYHT